MERAEKTKKDQEKQTYEAAANDMMKFKKVIRNQQMINKEMKEIVKYKNDVK